MIMKKIFTLFSAIAIGTAGFGQVVFQSDLSSWAAGDPTDWMGSSTNISSANVVEATGVSTYGASDASLINTTASHVRFTTQNVTVVPGETYEIEMWVGATMGMLRTGFYDVTNAAYNTYNTYFDMSVESAGSPVLLTQQVTVPVGCTTGQFILSLHSTDPTYAGPPFYIGIIVDSVAISATTPIPPAVVDIYDIQYTTDPSGDSPEAGNVITTRGIVTGVFAFGADLGRFFIQDGTGAWSGLYVYEDGTPVVLGDSVEVTGTVQEFYGLTELGSVTNVTVLASGLPQPPATTVSTLDAADEEYESVLVQVTDAICDDEDAGFGQFIVDDGTGDRLVDDQIYQYIPTLGNAYDVTGVTFLSFSEVKIMPRMASDITTVGWAGIEENNSFTMYPNPASGMVYMSVAPGAMVRIYTMTGAIVFEGFVKNQVDVSAFEAGIYQVTVTDGETVSTEKLVIR
jgi:hypothetical protein